MTLEEIRNKLGLEPFEEFAERQRAANKERLTHGIASGDEIKTRNTGRTTKMCVEAVAFASCGRMVEIDADTRGRRDELVDKARAYAKRCGVEPSWIRSYDWGRRGGNNSKLLLDHTEVDRRTEIYGSREVPIPAAPAPAARAIARPA